MAAKQGPSAPLGEEAAAPALEPGQPPQGVTSLPQEGVPLQGSVPPQEPLPEQEAEGGLGDKALSPQEQSLVPCEPASSHATVTVPPRSSTKRELSGTEEEEAEATRIGGTS